MEKGSGKGHVEIIHLEVVSEMGISESLSSWLSFGSGGPRSSALLGTPDPHVGLFSAQNMPRGKDQLTRIDTSRHGLRQKATESLPKNTSLWKCSLDVILDVVLKLFGRHYFT